MEIIKALNNIVVNLRKENIEHSVEKIMNLYDSNYPYTFNLIICKMVQTHISLNWENCNSYLCFLQTLQKSEEKEHPNQPKIFSIFENILEKSYKHEAFYLLDKMIECNLINSKITKDIKIKYFAHYKTEEENKKRYFNFDLFEEAFLNNYTELSRNDFELHKKYVKEGVNPNEIEKIIRNDEIEKLQEITSQNDFDFDQTIKPSLYERCDYINNYTKDEGVTLIDYAAFFGSVKCFKYLLMNGANIKKTGKYAVASGNLEIIHLCKQNNSSFKGSYKAAIKFHQNDIFHFLYENKFEDFNNQKSPIKFINILGATCISYDNYEILSFLEEEGMEPDQYIINRASTIGNLYLVKYFIKNNPTPKDILVFSVISKNIELVKYLLEQNLIDINAKNIYLFYLTFILIISYFKIIFGNSLNYFKQHLLMHLNMVIQKYLYYFLNKKELMLMLKIFICFI